MRCEVDGTPSNLASLLGDRSTLTSLADTSAQDVRPSRREFEVNNSVYIISVTQLSILSPSQLHELNCEKELRGGSDSSSVLVQCERIN